ncbi:MAG: hypothetical protein KAS01_02625 [Candidatus Pacebacteria bacterium]|nr:hypothetical protein [Candidatus Paceibacterota bacterium]
MQHEKEIKKWEEIVERSCTIPCVSEIKEQDKLWGSMRDFKERELENLKSSKTSKYADKLIESIEEELNAKTKLYCRDEECSLSNPCKIDSTKCIIDKSNLSSIKDENPPSIFYYYGKIIEYVIGFISKNFVVFMFSVILIILSFILFEIHKLKNKNNIH